MVLLEQEVLIFLLEHANSQHMGIGSIRKLNVEDTYVELPTTSITIIMGFTL